MVGLQLCALGLFAQSTASGFGLDDAWIFQTVARNFAETGVLGFVHGVPSSGATSVLWPWLLAINFRWLHVDPVHYALALGVASALFATVMLREILISDGCPSLVATIAAGAMAGVGNWLWLAVSGMEAALFVALGFGLVLTWSRASWGWASVFGGLLVLTRPEGLLLPGLLVLIDVARGRRVAVAAAAVPALVLAGLMLWSHTTRGSWLPTTMAGRRWLSGANQHPVILALELPITWMAQLVVEGGGRSIAAVGLSAAAIACAWAGAAAAWRRGGALFVLIAWALAQLLIYAIVLPDTGHGGRYQPMILALTGPLAVLGLSAALKRARDQAIVACLLGAAACVSTVHWVGVTREATAHINGVHRMVGRWLFAHIAAGEAVAAFDVGAVGFEMPGRSVIDLGGLVDREYVPYLVSGRVHDYIERHRIRILVLPEPAGDSPKEERLPTFAHEIGAIPPDWSVQVLYSRHTAATDFLRSYHATKAANPQVTVYRITTFGRSAQ